jgi:hypothetical protein
MSTKHRTRPPLPTPTPTRSCVLRLGGWLSRGRWKGGEGERGGAHPRLSCRVLPALPPSCLWRADPDLIICGKLPGIAIARVGPRHDGQCVGYACDSFVNPAVLARICDECNYGSFEGRW